MFNFKNTTDKKLRMFCAKCASGRENPAEQAILLYRFIEGKIEPVNNIVKWDKHVSSKPSCVMDKTRFEVFLNEIRKGGEPCVVGHAFLLEQIKVIKSIYAEQNRELDSYFKTCIAARLFR
jgi:hypothetical protein